MIVLRAPPEAEPAEELMCSNCAEVFWIDPCGEENLILNKNQCLVAKCPKCGLVDQEVDHEP